MRATLISMLAVAALAVGVCVFSLAFIDRVATEMDGMRVEVLKMVEDGDMGGAKEQLRRMAEVWSGHEDILAVIAPHDALHEIAGLIIEGNANLEADDLDDFNRSMELLGEVVRHLHAEEELKLANIL